MTPTEGHYRLGEGVGSGAERHADAIAWLKSGEAMMGPRTEKAVSVLLDAHAGALRDAEALRDERDELTDVLHRGGFVRCDIAACNCGSWHARFGYPERFREFAEALEQHGVNLHAGKTALNLLNEALDELDAARAALATNTKAQP